MQTTTETRIGIVDFNFNLLLYGSAHNVVSSGTIAPFVELLEVEVLTAKSKIPNRFERVIGCYKYTLDSMYNVCYSFL